MLYCYLISLLFHWGALSTYWDRIFGYDNYYAHGFAVGLAMLPFAWFGLPWWLIVFRAIILGGSMGLLCDLTENDVVEEVGRGALMVLSLIIFLR